MDEKRRKVAVGTPWRKIWLRSITTLGSTSTTMAMRMSSSRVSMGVAMRGNPMPMAL